jgi:octaprenyl-diphosphate synthase
MTSLNELKKPIQAELKEFDSRFKDAMKSAVPLLDRITYYIVQRKGKQIRPMFVFLSAKLFASIKEETYVAGSLIELLHTATLVHDDVVDDSHLRRGFFSINALWKNKVAVLVGDYLLSKGLLLALENGQYAALQIVSTAVKEMSEGELLQFEKSRKLDITEDVYFDIIRQKTASLIAAACSAGASSVQAGTDVVEQMRMFGQYAGIAFQIKDDLFDYGYKNIGKPTGIDIKEKKLTLPLIYALSKAENSERRRILKMIRQKSGSKNTRKEVTAFVKHHGGIDYSVERMNEYKEKAVAILETYPDNDSRTALMNLVQFVVDRSS